MKRLRKGQKPSASIAGLITTKEAIELLQVGSRGELDAMTRAGLIQRVGENCWNGLQIAAVRIRQLMKVRDERTKAEIAALLGVTEPTVQNIENASRFKRLGEDRYSVVEVVKGYLSYRDDEKRRTSRSTAEGRVREARAKYLELKVAERAHELIKTDEAISMVDDVFGTLKADA